MSTLYDSFEGQLINYNLTCRCGGHVMTLVLRGYWVCWKVSCDIARYLSLSCIVWAAAGKCLMVDCSYSLGDFTLPLSMSANMYKYMLLKFYTILLLSFYPSLPYPLPPSPIPFLPPLFPSSLPYPLPPSPIPFLPPLSPSSLPYPLPPPYSSLPHPVSPLSRRGVVPSHPLCSRYVSRGIYRLQCASRPHGNTMMCGCGYTCGAPPFVAFLCWPGQCSGQAVHEAGQAAP